MDAKRPNTSSVARCRSSACPTHGGGGNANGPSRGIDQGAGTVGFDCSGLYLYAFAGVGIKLDHYSGSQYNAGRKIPPSSQMRRGDLIFYGQRQPARSHVPGNGQMLEAPYTGSTVKISPRADQRHDPPLRHQAHRILMAHRIPRHNHVTTPGRDVADVPLKRHLP